MVAPRRRDDHKRSVWGDAEVSDVERTSGDTLRRPLMMSSRVPFAAVAFHFVCAVCLALRKKESNAYENLLVIGKGLAVDLRTYSTNFLWRVL
jgi:hypothetical protein